MPGVRLTAESVGTLKPHGDKRAETFFDRTKGAPSGFALRVTASGARTYYLIYRPAGSAKKTFLWIGDAARMSLAAAREKARNADSVRGHGADPLQERRREERTQRQRPTVAALLSQFV